MKHRTREEWLNAAVELFRPRFKPYGELPKVIHALTSFPCNSKTAVGQCFQPAWAKKKSTYIIISPVLDEPVEVLHTIIHELIHALGIAKHGKDFKKIALKLGLCGKMRATDAGPELRKDLQGIELTLGDYPHELMTPVEKPVKPVKKQILKYVSPTTPTYSCWITPAQAELVGPPICPISKQLMVLG